MRLMRSLLFRIRWWRWFMSEPTMFPFWMYNGITKLDEDSRRIVRARLDAEWHAREPKEEV